MIGAVDVDYRADATVAACIAFASWADATCAREVVVRSEGAAAPYEPGRFFERELPHARAALERLALPLEAIVVDGYAWLGEARAGLGAHLWTALGTPVVGVAKTAFRGAPAIAVVRGTSARPLYVTAAGMPGELAAELVRQMHGAHRIPTLLARVDRLSREG